MVRRRNRKIKRTKKGKGKIIIPFSSDEDFNIRILINSLDPKKNFLKIIIGLQSHEALYKLIIRKWDNSIHILGGIKK